MFDGSAWSINFCRTLGYGSEQILAAVGRMQDADGNVIDSNELIRLGKRENRTILVKRIKFGGTNMSWGRIRKVFYNDLKADTGRMRGPDGVGPTAKEAARLDNSPQTQTKLGVDGYAVKQMLTKC